MNLEEPLMYWRLLSSEAGKNHFASRFTKAAESKEKLVAYDQTNKSNIIKLPNTALAIPFVVKKAKLTLLKSFGFTRKC